MNWIALFWLPLVTGCRTARFITDEGVALQNHVIKTVTAFAPIKCRWDCVELPLCFSINVRQLPTGRVTCELNNSSKTADPQDLIVSAGSQLHQMAEVEHCTVEECEYKDALPDGWYRFGPKLLKFFPERRTWEQAELFCESVGGKLASINREEKNEFVYHLCGEIETDTTGNDPVQTITHWILDETDSHVNLVNGATYEEEDGVKSLYLDGSGAYATTPAVDFGTGTSFAVASWVKLQSPIAAVSSVYSDWSGDIKFLLNANEGGQLFFGVFSIAGHYEPWLTAGTTPIDKWFHLAAVWDSNANEVHLFLDGEKIATENVSSGSYPRPNSHTHYDIGLKRDGNNPFRGYIRDLMVVGKALTGEELRNMTDPFGGIWIGLNDVTSEGTFAWPDGTHVTYTKWASNIPNNLNDDQDCVRMTVDGGAWDETSCEKQFPFVCEKNV